MKYGTTNQQSNSLCEVQRYKASQKIILIFQPATHCRRILALKCITNENSYNTLCTSKNR